MKIIFMGTPEFAIPSLAILLNNGYNVVAVVTATDKLGGRNKQKLIESDIKKYAVHRGIRVLQPSNLKSDEFVQTLRSLEADVQIVVAFRMLPEVVWNMPALGTINLHGSLLPKYRGAAPINWAIINGESETGVTTFKLKHQIDTGDIMLQESIQIKMNDTAGSVHDRLKMVGANLILKTVQLIESNKIKYTPQDLTGACKAPKIFSEDCRIDFNQSAIQTHNFIRGLSPFPGAWTIIDQKKCKILQAKIDLDAPSLSPGEIWIDQKNKILIGTSSQVISLLEIQMAGKRKMQVRSFLNGYHINSSSIE